MKIYEINYSKLFNDKYNDYGLCDRIEAETEHEALQILYKKHKNINYILSIIEL